MRSNFEPQEMKEMYRRKAGESRGFIILKDGIIDEDFQVEGKKFKDHEKLKM